MKKIAVLVSGGVDSSVVLALLKEQGHDVTAFYLKIWLEDELSYLGTCPWEQDLEFARGVCDKLGVELRIVSMQTTYHQHVVSYMIAEIKAGRTPNPDILCNQFVKFGAFFGAIDDSFEYVATGHYAQIDHGQPCPSSTTYSSSGLTRGPMFTSLDLDPEIKTISILKKGKDPVKDQTYFLSNLSQAQLRRALFPIGHLEKYEVRALAEKFGLPTASRKDSQGICFLGKFNFADFVRAHLGVKAGDMIEFETGKKMGTHDGFWFFTIGQRQGIGLSGGPWYVVSKDAAANIVYISNQYDGVTSHKSGMIVENFNWNATSAISQPIILDVRFRHGPAVHAATVTPEGPLLRITLLQESSQGIAAGQFAVLYDRDVCLGGGVIKEAF